LALAQEKAKEVDEARVYYTLRKMRLRFIRSSAVKVVKYAVALMELGLPITAPLMTTILKKVDKSVLAQLHNLGDRHVLVLKRLDSTCYEWTLSGIFLKHYGSAEGDSDEVEA
jgi:hypothetical protein